ncbi:hypothetical protein V2I01_38830 [Micromonospora sp. BRA006-A]|nr:hypothetical protein [Micromonospora sp. BRA006-A]
MTGEARRCHHCGYHHDIKESADRCQMCGEVLGERTTGLLHLHTVTPSAASASPRTRRSDAGPASGWSPRTASMTTAPARPPGRHRLGCRRRPGGPLLRRLGHRPYHQHRPGPVQDGRAGRLLARPGRRAVDERARR